MIMDTAEIKSLLPHRYPFLMVDKIIEFEPRKRIVGIKNVSASEDFFNGHFPASPVMPGVLLIEGMAQTAGLAMLREKKFRGKIPFFTGIDEAKFRRPVVPGDQLRIEVDIVKFRGNVGVAQCRSLVDGEVAAEARLMFVVTG
jgi:3-hydroxyacyl-[acyl-carrier-protein] dehydratase